MRIFPATSCDYDVTCPPQIIFSGSTGRDRVVVGDLAGSTLPLTVTLVKECAGGKESWFAPSEPGQSCKNVCYGGQVACDGILGGCLCHYDDGGVLDGGIPDGGVFDGGGRDGGLRDGGL